MMAFDIRCYFTSDPDFKQEGLQPGVGATVTTAVSSYHRLGSAPGAQAKPCWPSLTYSTCARLKLYLSLILPYTVLPGEITGTSLKLTARISQTHPSKTDVQKWPRRPRHYSVFLQN